MLSQGHPQLGPAAGAAGVTPVIRDAAPDDQAEWRGLWDQYLTFYKINLDGPVTDRTWARLLDPAVPMAARLAFGDGRMLGFAIHITQISTWVAGHDVYLEDLFVAPAARGHGVGRALIDDLIALGRARGWHRLSWHTDIDNERARALYDSYTPHAGVVRYRFALDADR